MINTLITWVESNLPSTLNKWLFTAGGVLGTAIQEIIKDDPQAIMWLVIFLGADWIYGNFLAMCRHKWDYHYSLYGLMKKFAILFIVGGCIGLDRIIHTVFIQNAAIFAFSAVELGSILQRLNTTRYAPYIPPIIRDIFKAAHDHDMEALKKLEQQAIKKGINDE